jgi:DNA-directed RNA polymerase specialized sigma24 family protein
MESSAMGSSGVQEEVTAVTVLGFEEFFQAEHVRLARALYLLTGTAAEADELSQDTMVRVYERWDRVRQMDSPQGYLFRTALNLHRSRLRGLASRARHIVQATPSSDPAEVVQSGWGWTRPTSRSVLPPPAGDVKGVSQPPSRVSRDALTASA